MYITLDFLIHLLLQSTLLDNYRAIYLVNSKELLDRGTFVKVGIDDYVEARTTSLLILGRGTCIIKNVVNKPEGPCTKDLILYNVAVVKGFYINIVSEAWLAKKKAWYYRYDLTIRLGDKEENVVLIQLERRFNLVFLEYKPLSIYFNVLFEIPISTSSVLIFPTLERLIKAWYKRLREYLKPRSDLKEK